MAINRTTIQQIGSSPRARGTHEKDNEQKTDPLTSLLHAIAGGNGSAFKPVADDPERAEQGED